MSGVRHHLTSDTLAEYAAGRIDEARSVVIASHLAVCPSCSAEVAAYEVVGGDLLSQSEPVSMADDALEKIFAKADATSAHVIPQASHQDEAAPEERLPISAYLPDDIDNVNWKFVAPGLSQSVIPAQGYRDGVLRLLKIKPGTKIPKHTHGGSELTMILRGAYRDEIGEFNVGDIADLDGEQTHAPEAIGDEPCICLIATSAPLEFKTLTGRIAQPFIGL